jgi:preprotein translocase subunit SecD
MTHRNMVGFGLLVLVTAGFATPALCQPTPPVRSGQSREAVQPPMNGLFAVLPNGTQRPNRVFSDPIGQGATMAVGVAPIIGVNDIKTAVQSVDMNGMPMIQVTLTAQGVKKFSHHTRAHIGGRIAIIIDDDLISVPVILGPIYSNTLQILGNMTYEEARTKAEILSRRRGR